MNLRWKLFIPLATLGMATSVYINHVWKPHYIEVELDEHVETSNAHLNTLASSLTDSLLKGELSAVYSTLDSLKAENRSWLSLQLNDARGRLVYPLEPPPGLPGDPVVRDFTREINYLGRPLGEIRLRVDFSGFLARIQARVEELQAILYFGIVLMLVLVGALMEVLLIRPLAQLSLASRRLALKDYDVPLPAAHRDELGVLTNDFASMRAAIRQHAGELTAENRRRREAEEQAARELVTRRDIMEAVPDCLYVLDTDGFLVSWNRRLETASGYRPDELYGRHASDLIVEEDRPVVETAMKRAMVNSVSHARARLLCKDGSAVPFFWTGAVLINEDGRKAGVAGVGRDIRVEIEAERALQDSETRFRSLVETSSDWVWATDASGRYTYSGPQVRTILGFEPDEMLGRKPFDLMPPDEADRIGRIFGTLAARGAPIVALENINLHRDGHAVILETSAVPILDAGGELLGYRGIDRDITQRRQAEEARRARDAALEASQLKSVFLATMSHEIRTPLNGVIGMLSLMSDWPLSDEQGELVATAADSAQHLLGLLNAVLDYSRLEAGPLALESIDFDLHALVGSVLGLYRANAAAKGLELRERIQPDLPAVLRGDPTRLRQLLINLVDNAIKFTSQGEVEVRVADAGGAAGDGGMKLRFEVRDTGIGIPLEQQERVFDLFSQADSSTTRRFGGTGLGLALVRQLAVRMGGLSGVESIPGQGSTFWFTVSLAAATAARPAARTGSRKVRQSGLHVLLAEDNPVNQKVAISMLERFGCSVQVAVNGEQAVAAASRDHFDLIFMDCQMPVLDGLNAARRIREQQADRHVPIIAMTADVLPGDPQRCLAAGMDDYLSKPITLGSLHAVLTRWQGNEREPGSAQSPGQGAVMDLQVVRELVGLMGAKFPPLVRDFLADAEHYLASMQSAAEQGRPTELYEAAHYLKGSSANIGAPGLTAYCEQIGQQARTGERAGQLEAIARAADELARVGVELLALSANAVCHGTTAPRPAGETRSQG